MKVKLKIDRKAIQEFLLEHVEKIVFAAVVVCFALIVYRATAREMFPETPDGQRATPEMLVGYAGDAKEHWEQTILDEEVYATPDYLSIADLSRKKIDDTRYPLRKVLDRPLQEERRLRGLPRLFSVEGLRGTADCGRVSMIVQADKAAAMTPGGGVVSGMGATEVQGQRWVVLTGLVPVGEEFQEYYEYFKTAQKRTPNDLPVYLGYIVERAELRTTDPNEPLVWSETFYSGRSRKQAARRFAQTSQAMQQVVDPGFLDQTGALSYPLPPVVDQQWGESVVHDPEIPLFRPNLGGYASPQTVQPGPEAIDDPFAVRNPNQPYFGGGEGAYGGETGYAAAGGYGVGGEYDGPAGGFGGAMEGPSMPGQPSRGPQYKLFRFFDFDVEPGKRYRYRVKLVLRNPNLGIEDRYLSQEVRTAKTQIEQEVAKLKAEGKTREVAPALRKWQLAESDPTEPSDVISVPRDSRLLVLSVQPSPRVAAEPSGKVLVVSWVQKKGIEAYTEKSVGRGKVANFPGLRFPEKAKQTRPKQTRPKRSSRRAAAEEDTGYFSSESYGQPVDEPPLVDYLTDTLVLDLHGGQRLPGKDRLTGPGAILLMDPDGTLLVRQELDDKAESKEIQERPLPGAEYENGYPGGGEFDGEYGSGMEYDGSLDKLRD